MPVTAVKTRPNGSKLLSNGNVLTPEGRMSYVTLFEARKAKNANPNAKAKFSCALLFQKGEDISLLVDEVKRVMNEKFGSPDRWPKKWKNPILKQDDYEGDEYTPGAFMIRCNSTRKPGVVDASAQQVNDPAQVYSGAHGRLTVRAYWYDTDGNKGVSLGLQNAQMTRDGEPLAAGGSAATDEFESFGDDPMGGGKPAAGGGDSLDTMFQ